MVSYSWAFLGTAFERSRQADKGIAQGVLGILRDFYGWMTLGWFVMGWQADGVWVNWTSLFRYVSQFRS
jgi:hypothetical protein